MKKISSVEKKECKLNYLISFFVLGVYSISCLGMPATAHAVPLTDPKTTPQAEKTASDSSSVMPSTANTNQASDSLHPDSPLSRATGKEIKTAEHIGNELFEYTKVGGKSTYYKKTTYQTVGKTEVVKEIYEIAYSADGSQKKFYTYFTVDPKSNKSERTSTWSGTYDKNGLLVQTYNVSFNKEQKRTTERYDYYAENTKTKKNEIVRTWTGTYEKDGKTLLSSTDKDYTTAAAAPVTAKPVAPKTNTTNTTNTTPPAPVAKPAPAPAPVPLGRPDLTNAVIVDTYSVSYLLNSNNTGFTGAELVLDIIKEPSGRTHVAIRGATGNPDTGETVSFGREAFYTAFDVTNINVVPNSNISFTTSNGDISVIELGRTVNTATGFAFNMTVTSNGIDSLMGSFRRTDKLGLTINGSAFLTTRETDFLASQYKGAPDAVSNYEWAIKNGAPTLMAMKNSTTFFDSRGVKTEVTTEQSGYLSQGFGRYTLANNSVPNPFDKDAFIKVTLKAYDPSSSAIVSILRQTDDLMSHITFSRTGAMIGGDFVTAKSRNNSTGSITIKSIAFSTDTALPRLFMNNLTKNFMGAIPGVRPQNPSTGSGGTKIWPPLPVPPPIGVCYDAPGGPNGKPRPRPCTKTGGV